MKAHIIGGGFGGLSAAAYLIRNGGVPGKDITIYEAEQQMGGAFFLIGNAQDGYNLPGSLFDYHFRCTFDLFRDIPSSTDPAVSVTDEFFDFNKREPFDDRARLIDRDGRAVHGPRFGLSWKDGFNLVRLSLTPESRLDGRRIDAFFSDHFFKSEFWLCYSTVMGALPQHSAAEFRRYINRTLHMLPYISDMKNLTRTRFNQHQTFIEPLVTWLSAHGVNLQNGTYVRDIHLAPSPDHITVDRLDIERNGVATSLAVTPDDIVLLTFGSQVSDASTGSMTEAPRPNRAGRSWSLWQRLAQQHPGFGNPAVYFGEEHKAASRWVSFTVTTTGPEFLDQMEHLTGSTTGRGGMVSLVDSNWMLSLSVFHQPEIIGQPEGTYLWWGYGLFPERPGNVVHKPMRECTGAEILEEVLSHLPFEQNRDVITATSTCIPYDMPYVNNIWTPRTRTDRPRPVPDGSTNLGLIGQYVELEKEVAFIIEYSARSAWEAVQGLLKRGPNPPPVYQARYDPAALFAALKVFLFPRSARPKRWSKVRTDVR